MGHTNNRQHSSKPKTLGGIIMEKSKIQKFLEENKMLTEKQVLDMIPVCRQTWLDGVKDGRFPEPIKFGLRLKFYREEIIHQLMKEGIK